MGRGAEAEQPEDVILYFDWHGAEANACPQNNKKGIRQHLLEPTKELADTRRMSLWDTAAPTFRYGPLTTPFP